MCISYGLNCSIFSRYWQFWIHFHWSNVMIHEGGQDYSRSAGARPTNTVHRSNSKFYQHLEGVLWIRIRSTDHNEILHTSSQLPCRDVQNFIVIGWKCYKQKHCKVSLNFEFDRNIVNGTGAWCHFHSWYVSNRGWWLSEIFPKLLKYGLIKNWIDVLRFVMMRVAILTYVTSKFPSHIYP